MFKKTRLKASEKIKQRQKAKQLQARIELQFHFVERARKTVASGVSHYVVTWKRGSRKDNLGSARVTSDATTPIEARQALDITSVLFERSSGDQKDAAGSTAGIAFHSKELVLGLREGSAAAAASSSASSSSSSSSSGTSSSGSGKETREQRRERKKAAKGGTLLGMVTIDLAKWVGTSGLRSVQLEFDNGYTVHAMLRVTWLKYKGKRVVHTNPDKEAVLGAPLSSVTPEQSGTDGFDDFALVTEADRSGGSSEGLDTTIADDMTGMQTEDDSSASEMDNDLGEELETDPFDEEDDDGDGDYRKKVVVQEDTDNPLASVRAPETLANTALCTLCWERISMDVIGDHVNCTAKPRFSLTGSAPASGQHQSSPSVASSGLGAGSLAGSASSSAVAGLAAGGDGTTDSPSKRDKKSRKEKKAAKKAAKAAKKAAAAAGGEPGDEAGGSGEPKKRSRVKRLSQIFTGGSPLAGMSSSSLAASSSDGQGEAEGESSGAAASSSGAASSSKKKHSRNREKRGSFLGAIGAGLKRRSSRSKSGKSSGSCGGYFQGMMPMIIDHGSGMLKSGFAGDAGPRFVAPSLIGVPRFQSVRTTTGTNLALKDCYIGQAALAKRGLLALSYPIKSGVVQNWDHVQKIWQMMYQEFEAQPANHPVLITQPPLNPRSNREKLLEIFLETFEAPAISIASPGFLALCGSGRRTGVVLDVGDGIAHSVALYEGNTLSHTVNRMDLAGREITEYLITLLMENGGQSFSTSSEKDIVRQIKEKHGYVAERFDSEMHLYQQSAAKNICYTMPDGQTIIISNERFRCTEPLFRPPLIGKEYGGLHQLLFKTVTQSDPDIWKDLYQNIILSGGSTMFPGFEQRLQHELSLVAPVGTKMRFISQAERTNAVWLGGKTWLENATPAECEAIWVSAKEYDEYGANIIDRRFYN